jgi:hypothetical protein
MPTHRDDLRAADSDREHVLERLRVAAGEGRLDPEEHERRTELALAARTLGELKQLTRDLPRPAAARGERGARARVLRALRIAAASGYLAMAVLLISIWALTGGGYFWPVWPLLGWGVPLFAFGATPVCSHKRRHSGLPRGTTV